MESLLHKLIEDKLLLTLGAAIIGLIGIVVGVFLNGLKEWLFQNSKTRKDAEYLAVRVVVLLDSFVNACVDVAFDDGMYEGELSSNNYAKARTSCPTFNTEIIQHEWKSLPAGLLYEILNFPNCIANANNRINDFFENDCPPDFSDGFAERQFQYAKLGLQADQLASKLRRKMSLPKREVAEHDPVLHLKRVKDEIDSFRAEQARQHQQVMTTLAQDCLI